MPGSNPGGVVVTRGVALLAENSGSFIGGDLLPALRKENGVGLPSRYFRAIEIGAGDPSLLAGDRNLWANTIGIQAGAEDFQRLADECFAFGTKRARVQCWFRVEGQADQTTTKTVNSEIVTLCSKGILKELQAKTADYALPALNEKTPRKFFHELFAGVGPPINLSRQSHLSKRALTSPGRP